MEILININVNIASMAKKWRMPPRIKVLEALGSIGDARLELFEEKRQAKVTSSMGDKQYTINYDESRNAIDSDDNGSVYKGYLGYPSIAVWMVIGKLSYEPRFSNALKGIEWKKLNDKYKSYAKVEELVKEQVAERGISSEELDLFVDKIMKEIEMLASIKFDKDIATLDSFI
ncbi:MAG: hypothetical protein KAJ51_08005 [Thermoplasmata archaeon]|nr:hypothetical protein [Thermoplasmata archaeon]